MNMVRFKVSRHELTAVAAQAILKHIAADKAAGTLAHIPIVLADVFDEATELSRLHGEKVGSRGYDLLHIAAARVLGLANFLTFDVQQARFAVAAGLRVHS